MAIEYTWRIDSVIRTNDNEKGVVKVAYMIEGFEDGDLDTSAYGQGEMTFTPDPSASGFVPFENLTQEDVIGWVQAKLGDEEIEKIKAQIVKMIEVRKNPPTVAEIPWTD